MGEYICPKCNKVMSETKESCVVCRHCLFRRSIDWLDGWYAALKSGAQPPQADNKTQAEICQIIVEDIMDFFRRETGFFMHVDGSRKSEVRNNLFRIVAGKLSAVR